MWSGPRGCAGWWSRPRRNGKPGASAPRDAAGVRVQAQHHQPRTPSTRARKDVGTWRPQCLGAARWQCFVDPTQSDALKRRKQAHVQMLAREAERTRNRFFLHKVALDFELKRWSTLRRHDPKLERAKLTRRKLHKKPWEGTARPGSLLVSAADEGPLRAEPKAQT
jgi:hypothetical protein